MPLVWLAFGAILIFFTVGLSPTAWALWFAPVALVLGTRGTTMGKGRALCSLATLAGLSGNITYYWMTTGPLATVVLIALQMLAWSFYANSTRLLLERERSWWVVWRLPLSMAMVEGLMARFSPHGSWGSLATSQIDFPVVLQIASLVGSPGIVFLAGLFASLLSLALLRRKDVDNLWLAYGLPVAVLLAASSFGVYRLRTFIPSDSVKVGLVAVDEFRGSWAAYEARTKELSAQGAELVVWGEKIEKLSEADSQAKLQSLAALARSQKVTIVAGVQLEARNIAWVMGAAGELFGVYQKQQLVPHLEADLKPGAIDSQFNIAGRRVGIVICRDLFFSGLARRYGLLQTQFILTPAWDFYRDAKVSSAVAAIRGVESGFAVVRASREGWLWASDELGRVVAQEPSKSSQGVGLLAQLPIGQAAPTLYARLGDWFSWLCLACFFLLRRMLPKR